MTKNAPLYYLLCFILCGFIPNSTGTRQSDVKLTGEELKLYNLLITYRTEHGLKQIQLSKSLTLVAQTHVRDLEMNNPAGGNCNMHSWSEKGKWGACCYTPDHAQAKCMWDKPRQLTSYTGNGFEIATGGVGPINAEMAMDSWKGSPAHNDVVLNNGQWEEMHWNAIGVGIFGEYAVVWFGSEIDKDGEPGKTDQP